MLTREQIEEIQTESRERGISVKNLLKEKGIPDHQYFWCDNITLNVPSRAFSNVPFVTDSNVPLQKWLL